MNLFQSKYPRRILLFLHAMVLTLLISHSSANEVIKHYNQGFSPLLRVYLTDVLKLTLDATTPEYGPYEMQYFSQFLSSNRSKLETEKGILLDLLFSPHWRGHYVNTANVIPVEFPVLNGMLGLRSLILTQENVPGLKQSLNQANFKQMTAGLGAKWVDVEILAANNIQVVEAQKFDALFPMLMHKRFDYVPLSVLEAQTALVEHRLIYSDLVISEDISLFYPIPFYLYVNAQRPALAERLQKGLEITLADGSLDTLFDKHFAYVHEELKRTRKHLVVLNNPLISAEKNRAYVQQFLRKYRSSFSVIPHEEEEEREDETRFSVTP
jgi:hypothetical protein